MSNQLLGYEERRLEGVQVIARTEDVPFVLAILGTGATLHEHAGAHAVGQLAGGRGPVPVIAGPGEESWAVRHYWRGGAVARALADRYLRFGMPRPIRELEVHAILRSRGVSTPPMVAAVVYEQGAWYRGDVATVLIPGAADLAELTLGADRWEEREREHAWFAAGELLRTFFATGAEHHDLNLRNIIVRRETLQAYLLDLDACVLRQRSRSGAPRAMLARFHRSRRKLERIMGGTVATRELAALKRGRGS